MRKMLFLSPEASENPEIRDRKEGLA